MAQTITPVVHGGSRKRWAGSVALHVLGAAISAAALGAALGASGALLGAPWGRAGMIAVAAIALAYAAREILGVPVPIPELRRQVPEWWRGSFGPPVSALLYGVALGPGFGTHLRHGTFVAAAAGAAALGDPVLGIAMLLPFGVARTLGVALVSGARTEPGVMAAGERLERMGSGALPRAANAAVLLGLAIAAALAAPSLGTVVPWLWPAILASTFGWAAAAKLLGPNAWHEALGAHELPPPIERLAVRVVPIAEASVVVLLLTGPIRVGAALALLLLAAFSLALVRVRKAGQLPCGCFGGRARRSVPWLLTRNAALGLVAIASMVAGEPIPLPSAPDPGELFPAALAAGGLGLTTLLLARVRSAGASERSGH